MADATSPPRKVRRTSEEHKDDGFQFTKKSRRAKTATVNLSTRKSASAKKTKRRRSSFVRGRNDRKSLLTTKSPVKTYKPDLCKDIPADLPLEHKLSLLVKASLQLVIDKLEGDSSDVDSDIPNFNEEAISVFKQLKEAVDDCEINKLIQQTADEQEHLITVQSKGTSNALAKRGHRLPETLPRVAKRLQNIGKHVFSAEPGPWALSVKCLTLAICKQIWPLPFHLELNTSDSKFLHLLLYPHIFYLLSVSLHIFFV
ncbi:uncharacterized protein LOC5519363 isoform X2 [Nematostella vectensis]|uniref:uncharacterized protein LOC5519363 isoform X2 n=1 Tax=Nematostella vectensis TaxID=45351 RepID=UPI00138FCD83|nr:uncharacterized protein LOC5519363 isoform X2 [Nematostella vectensis]